MTEYREGYQEYLADGRQRCKARNRQQKQCGRPAIAGGAVCYVHGGAAPQVRQKAKLRLLELVDPAIATMAKIMIAPETKDADRLRAVENILDRTGIARTAEMPEPALAIEMVLTRIRERRAGTEKE